MNLPKTVEDAMQYVMAAAARIFSPTDDKYPEVGVQPFEGEPYKGQNWED
ncbi:MAG: hypothetical protein MUC60_12010 [Oscillatoria sp. Prado101]|jgi:hypothetical protein|nr:hypothetical protein [Oscillatoria sp. Prado101]